MLILIIAGGPDKGRMYELTDGEPIVLGREGDQVKLNDRKVSREHARLWSEGGQWYLKDLGSRHGTYRNHVELERGQQAKLKDGDYLQVGNTVMVLGRMQAEQTERVTLLGGASQDPPKRHRAQNLVAGASLVALIGVGAYMAIQLESLKRQSVPREAFTQLQQELIDAQQDQTDRIEQSINRQTGVSRQLLSNQQRLTGSLDDTNRAITQHQAALADAAEQIGEQTDPILARLAAASETAEQQQAAIERLGQMLAQQRADDKSPQLLAAVNDMKAQLAKQLADQPGADTLLARLDEAVKANAQAAGQAVQAALAEHRAAARQESLASARGTEQLMNRVLDGLAKLPTQAQIAEEVRLAVAQRSAEDEQFMRLVLAELRRTGDQITTDVTAAVGEDAGQAQALMQQVVAELGKRPTGEQLAGELSATMQRVLAQRDADTARPELAGLMRQVLTELEQRPTSEQLAADLRRFIGEDAQQTERLIARVLGELDTRPTAAQIAQELQAADNENAAKTASLLEQVLAKIDTQQQLTEQIAGLREQIESVPGRDSDAVRSVLARLDEQDKNHTEMLRAIGALRKAIPDDLPDQLDTVLAQLDEQVRTEQITNTIEESMQRIAAAQDKQTQATLASFSQRLDALPGRDELAALTDSQAALAQLLDKSDAREQIGQLRVALERLAGQMDAGPSDELDQIIAMLKRREKAELLLAELHDAMKNQSAQTEQLKLELLAAVESIDQTETAKTLRGLISAVNSRLITEASVRQAVRDEMRGTILPNQKALADARDVTTEANPTRRGDDQEARAVDQRRLTRLESAYKRSFETGRPVTVGAGVVDPLTGQVSKGRKLDPAVAKTLGFETWRDWYLTDRHAEKMRLQQQALRQRNANDAQDAAGTIKLPGDTPGDTSQAN